MSTPELDWVAEARKYIGLREDTSKSRHNPTIVSWLKKMGSFTGEARSWYLEDETPWCGLFVGYCLGVTNRFVVKDWYRAKAWADTTKMTKLDRPAYGCLAVYTREGGGHVAFVVGKDSVGRIVCLGGNQGNAVSLAPFAVDRPAEYFWPSTYKVGVGAVKSVPAESKYALPIVGAGGKVSTQEA